MVRMVTGGHGAREVSRCWLAGPRPENWRHDAAEKLRPRLENRQAVVRWFTLVGTAGVGEGRVVRMVTRVGTAPG